MTQAKRRFISVDDIYQMYLPLSKKRIRWLLKRYLPDKTKIIGGRIYTDREALKGYWRILAGRTFPWSEVCYETNKVFSGRTHAYTERHYA